MRYIKTRIKWLEVFLYTKASQPIRKERESNKVKASLTLSGKEEIRARTSFIKKFYHKGGQGKMAIMHDLAVEISKRTGIDTDTVKQVLRELGDSALEVMKKSENRLHIPQLGVFEIEKLPRKRKPTLIFKPSLAVSKYKLQEV